jgi:hypothetical protein
MTEIVADRVLETTTTTGTGALTLAGAVVGFRTFASVCANGDTAYYYAEEVDASGVPTGAWETGIGTWGTGGVFTRTTVHASSNAGAAVSFAAGTKRVGLAVTAAKVAAATPSTIVCNGNAVDLPAWSPVQRIQVGGADGVASGIGIDSFATTPQVVMRRANGTNASKSAIVTGASFFSFLASGYKATVYSGNAGAFSFNASENWTDTATGCQARIGTTPIGSTTRVQSLTISDTEVAALGQLTGSALGTGVPVTKTADFTVVATETSIINNKSGSTCTATLPAAASYPGRWLFIKNHQAQLVVSASSNVVPQAGGSAGTAILAATAGKWALLQSDNSNWQIMLSN